MNPIEAADKIEAVVSAALASERSRSIDLNRPGWNQVAENPLGLPWRWQRVSPGGSCDYVTDCRGSVLFRACDRSSGLRDQLDAMLRIVNREGAEGHNGQETGHQAPQGQEGGVGAEAGRSG